MPRLLLLRLLTLPLLLLPRLLMLPLLLLPRLLMLPFLLLPRLLTLLLLLLPRPLTPPRSNSVFLLLQKKPASAGFFLVHRALPGKAALIFRKK